MFDESNESEFLTKFEASRFLNCGTRSLGKWKQLYGLPFVKIGNFVRYPKSQLREWMLSQLEIKGQKQNTTEQEGVNCE